MTKFKANKTYTGNFINGGTFEFKVTRRTAKSIWVQDDFFYKTPTRRKIYIDDQGSEYVKVMDSQQIMRARRTK